MWAKGKPKTTHTHQMHGILLSILYFIGVCEEIGIKVSEHGEIYRESIRKIEKKSKLLHVLIVCILIPIYVIGPVGSTIYGYNFSHNSTDARDSFKPIYTHSSFPFDWKTPIGYSVSAFIHTITIYTEGAILVVTMVVTIGMCVSSTSFIADIEDSLRDLNENFIKKINKLNRMKRLEMKTKLFQILQFYGDAREFAERFSTLNSGVICVFMFDVLFVMCSLFMQVESTTMESGLYRFVQSAMSISVLIPTLYMFCHFGSQVTHRFEDVADAIYQLEWYRLPLDSQKHLPMMLAMAQKKIYLRAFGRNIHCSRGVFAKIMDLIYSYFSVLREFNR